MKSTRLVGGDRAHKGDHLFGRHIAERIGKHNACGTTPVVLLVIEYIDGGEYSTLFRSFVRFSPCGVRLFKHVAKQDSLTDGIVESDVRVRRFVEPAARHVALG
jgi:hypothetical protein